MLVTYKWQLLVDPKTAVDLFQTEDFVGVACRKMQSKIREAAAELKFAEFQNDTVRHLQNKLFVRDQELPDGKGGTYVYDGGSCACVFVCARIGHHEPSHSNTHTHTHTHTHTCTLSSDRRVPLPGRYPFFGDGGGREGA